MAREKRERTRTRSAGGLARAASVLVALLATLAAAPGAAAAETRPGLGRWEGMAGAARVVFTVEKSPSGERFVVRPAVYCDPSRSTVYEVSPFSLFQPDAWPIAGGGRLQNAPLVGHFGRDHATLRVVDNATCAGRERFEAFPVQAGPTVFDGGWSVVLAKHEHGLIGEVTTFTTRGEGAVVDSDWGVYDGADCFFLRSGIELLVNADGSFSASARGNLLNTDQVTIHLSGRFVSSRVAQGSYTLSGPGCIGQRVAFQAVFTSAYVPPHPSTGDVMLSRPFHREAPKTEAPGGESAPEGGECKTLSSISPELVKPVRLKDFSVGRLPIALDGSLSLVSGGFCARAISAVIPRIELNPPGLGVTATYKVKDRTVEQKPEYSFVPLGWHVPEDSGAPKPEPPTIDWDAAATLPGLEVGPSQGFGWKPGERPEAGIELVKVPVLQPNATLIARGEPVLQFSLGPELSIEMHVNREELEKEADKDVAEGEDRQTAAEQVSEEVQSDAEAAIDAEEGAIAPAESVSGPAGEISGLVGDDIASSLAAEAGAGSLDAGLEASAIGADPFIEAILGSIIDELGGAETIEVIVIVLADKHHHPLPPGLHPSRGRLTITHRLPAHRIRHLSRRGLHRAPFPARRVPALVRSALALPVPARVGRLVTTAVHLRPREQLSLIAPFLATGLPHDARLTLAGPGYRADRLLNVVSGRAGATIELPKHLARGTWTISVEDLAGVTRAPQGDALSGQAIVRFGVFEVGGKRRRG